MNGENSADLTVLESENYTFISPVTLEMVFPDERSSRDDVIREHLAGHLKERASEEKSLLQEHPFFSI